MKRSFFRRRLSKSFGFTLIELLVVIGIIAILAAVLFPSINSALMAAKRAKAANLANQIQTAALNYYGEYSVYPVPSTATAGTDYVISDASTSATAWNGLLYALGGNTEVNSAVTAPSTPPTNTHLIPFLNMKSSDVDNSGGPKNPATPSTGTYPYFNISINYSYSGTMGSSTGGPLGATSPTTPASPPALLPNFASSTTGDIVLTATTTSGVAVWANCNTSTTISTWNPKFFVSTY